MPQFMNTRDVDFEDRFQSLLSMKREDAPDVDQVVAEIIATVRSRGDEALSEYTAHFDRLELSREQFAFSESEVDDAINRIPKAERDALEFAASRIEAYHAKQLPEDASWTDEAGAELGWRWTPVSAAGLYVPGGLASYPSSVLMNAIPAKVAGVERVVMTTPTPNGRVNPLVLLAARLSGIETVYRLGGAHAIAALAYGTETIRAVDKITGPGNAWVAAAKRRVFGRVGIDMIAGPSEILIIADADNDPEWIAIDLLSQAEHDESAQSILITTSEQFGRDVATAVDSYLKVLERREIATKSWNKYGAIITVSDLGEAALLADDIAPEHLELCVSNPDALSENIRHAGAIFLGAWTPEAIGDYVGGSNHVLPTARSARFSSGLSVLDFMKRTTLTRMTPGAISRIGGSAETLAISESLEAHGLSVRARLDKLNE